MIVGAAVVGVLATGGTAALVSTSHTDRTVRRDVLVEATDVVQRGSLRDVVTLTGRVERATHTISAPSWSGGIDRIVTSSRCRLGETIRAGDVLATVSDRPVFVLAASVGMYRDLGPGDTGLDVARLQVALGSVSTNVARSELARFGPSTAASLSELYRRGGASVPTRPGRDGVPVPVALRDELRFVPDLPATVIRAGSAVGEGAADRPLCTLATGPGGLVAMASEAQAPAVALGQPAIARLPDGGELRGVVAAVTPADAADNGTAGGADVAGNVVRINLDPGDAPPATEGEVQVQVTVRAVEGVVHVAAGCVATDPDGTSRIVLLGPPRVGTERAGRRRLHVSVGDELGGRVVINAPDGEVQPGDRCLIRP